MVPLLEEMGHFYGSAPAQPVAERVRQVSEALFSGQPAAHALLAWDEGRLVGFAAYSFLWPATGLTRSLYLKELYVAEECQRRGAGRQLMQAIFEVAATHECGRVEWTTDENNRGAQDFYETLGLPRYPSKIFYRVESEGGGFPLSQ